MIRTRLKELNIKITELADYLQISRPTLYKFIMSYDDEDRAGIPSGICDLFKYIEKSELIDKRNVVNYIIQNLSDSKINSDSSESEKALETLKKYLSDSPDQDKVAFILKYLKTTKYDEVINYLLQVDKIMRKKKLTSDDLKYLKPYRGIISLINKED